MKKLAIVLMTVAAIALILGIIGNGYAQDGEGGAAGTASCCAVASAYDSADSHHLNVIRQFRDEYLMTNPVGRGVVALYYDVFSPPVAHFINDHPAVKPLARAALAPVLALSTVAVDTTLAEKMAITGVLALVSVGVLVWVKRRRRGGTLDS